MNRSVMRNLLIRLMAPFAKALCSPVPRIRVIALHDIPHAHEALFREKMLWLKEHCHIVSLENLSLRNALHSSRINIALTFDDGFKEYSTFVAPELARMGLPATFFTPSGALGISGEEARQFSKEGLKRSITFEFMTPKELRTIAENPLFTIGGHTTHHKDVATLDEKGLEEEITKDRSALESVTGKAVLWFAYPFGGVRNINIPAVKKIASSGYRFAFSIIPSFWRTKDHKYLIGRDSMSVTDSIALWEAWLSGGYDTLSAMKNASGKKALLCSLAQ